MAPFVFSRVYSIFLAAQGPMNTTFALGSLFLIRRAISIIGEGVCEMCCLRVGKLISMNLTNEGQHEVVRSFFSFHSLASL